MASTFTYLMLLEKGCMTPEMRNVLREFKVMKVGTSIPLSHFDYIMYFALIPTWWNAGCTKVILGTEITGG
ncbi:hypothetical protein SCA6_005999 [Theobroma cacao]